MTCLDLYEVEYGRACISYQYSGHDLAGLHDWFEVIPDSSTVTRFGPLVSQWEHPVSSGKLAGLLAHCSPKDWVHPPEVSGEAAPWQWLLDAVEKATNAPVTIVSQGPTFEDKRVRKNKDGVVTWCVPFLSTGAPGQSCSSCDHEVAAPEGLHELDAMRADLERTRRELAALKAAKAGSKRPEM